VGVPHVTPIAGPQLHAVPQFAGWAVTGGAPIGPGNGDVSGCGQAFVNKGVEPPPS
jgi:hypothetical protein